MTNDSRPFIKLNAQLVRYHTNDLMEQIAVLEDQIEANLQNKQSIIHLKNMIQERQRYLNEYIDVAKSTSQGTARRSSPR